MVSRNFAVRVRGGRLRFFRFAATTYSTQKVLLYGEEGKVGGGGENE